VIAATRTSGRLFGAVVCVLALAACGGKSATTQIVDVVQRGMVTTNPVDCTRLMTHAYLIQNHLGTDQTVLDVCQHDLRDPTGNPTSVDVSNVAVTGAAATVTVAIHGGDLDGQTLMLRLARDGQQWKLDRVESFLHFDRVKLLNGVLADFTVGPQALPRALGVCFTGALRKLDDPALQAVELSDDHSVVTRLLAGCVAQTGLRPPAA
jgi:hypothetical protein